MVVVLGEPGAGKSTELEREAARNPGALFLSIRGFLRAPDQDLQASTLFLDALDEMRASGGNQHEVLDRVIQRLNQLGRPRVRLSCRAADWFGALDRQELASASSSGEVLVVELQPLTEEEVEQIVRANLEDPSAFLEMVRRQRLEDWLGNPQTLELMLQVARTGDLPRTRTELFEKSCALMAIEENRTHRHATRGTIGQEEILEAAGFLFAVTLLAGLEGFAADRDDLNADFPPLDEVPGPQEELHAAIGSRLFRWQEGRAVPVHRTIAEFLAARTLRDRIRDGLPVSRVLRLMTGYDGGTLSDLRGLYAWLTTLTPEHASILATRDPVTLIFYGDPERTRKLAFQELINLATSRPQLLSNLETMLRDSSEDTEVYFLNAEPQTLVDLMKAVASTCPPQCLAESDACESKPPAYFLFDLATGSMESLKSSQMVESLIDVLGNYSDSESAHWLSFLQDDQSLSIWKNKLAQTGEQQSRNVLEQRYRRPSVTNVLKVLEGGGPTSLQDLHAIVCDHLRTLASEIENGPEDGYKTFWNVTGPGEKLQSPPPENVARDRLRSLLNPKLRPLGISAEIEGHYARSNRADLKIVFQSMNIPFEIKRHYHRDVWTAPRTQLKKKYSIDPEAKGFGIYLVFWFGEADGRRLPQPPAGIARPGTAAELESTLRELYSGEEWRDTEFVCIDCSPRKKAAKKKGQGTKRSRKGGP
jgi:hypothetical protein